MVSLKPVTQTAEPLHVRVPNAHVSCRWDL